MLERSWGIQWITYKNEAMCNHTTMKREKERKMKFCDSLIVSKSTPFASLTKDKEETEFKMNWDVDKEHHTLTYCGILFQKKSHTFTKVYYYINEKYAFWSDFWNIWEKTSKRNLLNILQIIIKLTSIITTLIDCMISLFQSIFISLFELLQKVLKIELKYVHPIAPHSVYL